MDQDEEDDTDSLNINFDDVNDQSDMEDYYTTSSSGVTTSHSINHHHHALAGMNGGGVGVGVGGVGVGGVGVVSPVSTNINTDDITSTAAAVQAAMQAAAAAAGISTSELFDIEQHFGMNSAFSSKFTSNLHHLGHHPHHHHHHLVAAAAAAAASSQSGKPSMNVYHHQPTASTLQSTTSPLIDNGVGDLGADDVDFGSGDSSKPLNRNIHCIKEKIRR